jgi:hypothetical protein
MWSTLPPLEAELTAERRVIIAHYERVAPLIVKAFAASR